MEVAPLTMVEHLSKMMAVRKRPCVNRWRLSAKLRSRPPSPNRRSKERDKSRRHAERRRRRPIVAVKMKRSSVSLRRKPRGSAKKTWRTNKGWLRLSSSSA